MNKHSKKVLQIPEKVFKELHKMLHKSCCPIEQFEVMRSALRHSAAWLDDFNQKVKGVPAEMQPEFDLYSDINRQLTNRSTLIAYKTKDLIQ